MLLELTFEAEHLGGGETGGDDKGERFRGSRAVWSERYDEKTMKRDSKHKVYHEFMTKCVNGTKAHNSNQIKKD